MEIKVAFYKGGGDLFNKIVRWWTKSPYSHVELILPDDVTWIRIGPFSSSKLCAIKKEKWDPKNWDFISITVTSEQVETIKEFFERTKGCKYDWWGMILSHLIPFKVKQRGKWYCSEWIAHALRVSRVIDWRVARIFERAKISPAILYEIVRTK
tara:strand:- start:1284 stop:1745 length:462 start_codon:yes stop_codon:yes gene_type:complete